MDKFGHHIQTKINKQMRLSNLLEFLDQSTKEENEEINLKFKRLTGITVPLKANDAVNKEYVDKQSEIYASKQEFRDLNETIKLEFQKYIDQFEKNALAKITKK